MKRLIYIILLLWVCSVQLAYSQCYEIIESNTGIPVLYGDDLESKACELKTLVNNTGPQAFEVLGCDFYPYLAGVNVTNGFEALFNEAIVRLNEDRESYAIITKEHQLDGKVFYRTHIKYPEYAPFDGLNSAEREGINTLFVRAIIAVASSNDFETPTNSLAEEAGLEKLRILFEQVINDNLDLSELEEPADDELITYEDGDDLRSNFRDEMQSSVRSSNGSPIYVTPAGEYIRLPLTPSEVPPIFQLKTNKLPRGALAGFYLDGEEYRSWWIKGTNRFAGYARVDQQYLLSKGKRRPQQPFFPTASNVSNLGQSNPVVTKWMLDDGSGSCTIQKYNAEYNSNWNHLDLRDRLILNSLDFTALVEDGAGVDASEHRYCNESPFKLPYTTNTKVDEGTYTRRPQDLDSIDHNNVLVIDETGRLSEAERNGLKPLLAGIEIAKGVNVRLIITDHQTGDASKRLIRNAAGNLNNEQVLAWIDIKSDRTITFDVVYGPGVVEDLKRVRAWNSQSFWEQMSAALGEIGSEGLVGVSKMIYVVSDFAVRVLEELEISEKVYDPSKNWEYYNYVKKAFLLINPGVQALEGPFEMYVVPHFPSLKDVDLGGLSFAVFCGLWNGLVGEAKGIFQTTAMLGYWGDSGTKDQVDGLIDKFISGEIWGLIIDQAKDAHTGTPHYIAHQVGKDIIFIVTIVVPFTKATKASQLAKVINFVDDLNIINQAIKVSGLAIRQTTNGIAQIVRKVDDVVVDVIGKIEDGVVTIFEQFYRETVEPTLALLELLPYDRVRLEAVGTGNGTVKMGTHGIYETPNGGRIVGLTDEVANLLGLLMDTYGINSILANRLLELNNAAKLVDQSIITKLNDGLGAKKWNFLEDLADGANVDGHLAKHLDELTPSKISGWEALANTPVAVRGNVDNVSIAARHLDETGESTTSVANQIADANGFDPWRHSKISAAGGRTELTNRLDIYGYPSSANAVTDAANVANRNKSKLANDADLPNAVDDYTFTVNGNTYTKGASESWKDYFTRLKNSGDLNGFESHHIFPVNLFKRESFRKWYELIGRNSFNMNGEDILENLIMLEKKTNGRGVHSNHPAYTDRIGQYFDDRFAFHKANNNFDEAAALDELTDDIMNLRANLKASLLENSVRGTTELSTYWDNINFNSLID